jgi:hypothetical protein
MKARRRERFGAWLERFTFLHRWLLEFDGIAPNNRGRYVNRVSRHLVLKDMPKQEK